MDTSQIEQKLTRRPASPLFARLADAYVRDGRTESAKELLLSGLEKYPAYPAAHLVLARCYAMEQDYAGALGHLRTAVAALPEVDHLLDLEEEWEETSRRMAPSPMVLHADPADSVVSTQAEIVPAAESVPVAEMIPATESAPVAESTPVNDPDPLAALPASITIPAIPRPHFVAPPRPPVRTTPVPAGRIEDGRIVSKTLAEIYAMQGEYGEAIITYTMLKHHRPQLSAECDLRISELEQALQAKLHQQKVAVTK